MKITLPKQGKSSVVKKLKARKQLNKYASMFNFEIKVKTGHASTKYQHRRGIFHYKSCPEAGGG